MRSPLSQLQLEKITTVKRERNVRKVHSQNRNFHVEKRHANHTSVSPARKSQLVRAHVYLNMQVTASFLAQPSSAQIWTRGVDKRKRHERLGTRGCRASRARETIMNSIVRSIVCCVVRRATRTIMRKGQFTALRAREVDRKKCEA